MKKKRISPSKNSYYLILNGMIPPTKWQVCPVCHKEFPWFARKPQVTCSLITGSDCKNQIKINTASWKKNHYGLMPSEQYFENQRLQRDLLSDETQRIAYEIITDALNMINSQQHNATRYNDISWYDDLRFILSSDLEDDFDYWSGVAGLDSDVLRNGVIYFLKKVKLWEKTKLILGSKILD